MPAEYLVEYNLQPDDPEYTDHPAVYTTFAGRMVFEPNSQLDSRRAVVVDTPEKQKEILVHGNIGVRSGAKPRFVIPSDLAGIQERERIRGVVLDYLIELGIVPLSGHGHNGNDAINANEAAVKEAQRLGVDLKTLKGTGKGGQINTWDVRKAAGAR